MFKLKEIRNAKGISQQKLADKLGVARSTIAMWESGSSQPDHETLIQLAELLDVTPNDLLGVPSAEKELPFKTFFAHDDGQLENMSFEELYELQMKIMQIIKDKKQ